MRLINVSTLELEEFIGADCPPYAILSHRWTKEELNFKEVAKRRIDRTKKGYRKLLGACQTTAKHDLYADLSEAINSMWSWYRDSAVCLAYLEDVETGPTVEEQFKESVWFTRSWTLQELLAPRSVEFYDGEWASIGTKDSLASIIEGRTGIDSDALLDSECIRERAIAVKMSWAADRTATRAEDIAYSLMGIFGINMALLYGEGQDAFTRLQKEIIQNTDDPSFLWWQSNGDNSRLLANSPADFREARGSDILWSQDDNLFGITNIGLEMTAQKIKWQPDVCGLIICSDFYHNYILVAETPVNGLTRKLSISSVPVSSFFRRESCKVIVAWGNEGSAERRDEVSKALSQRYDHPHTYGFCLQVDSSITARVSKIKESRWNSRPQQAHTVVPNESYVEIAFDRPWVFVAARVICWVNESYIVSIYLSYDMDSRPCAHIYKEAKELFASELEYPTESNKYENGEDQMIYIPDNVRGHHAWFLRNESIFDTVARMPEEVEFMAGVGPLWLYLTPVKYYEDGRRFWTFSLVNSQPRASMFAMDELSE